MTARMKWLKPTVVIHCAGLCGGIEANRTRPGEFLYENAVMGLHVMEGARRVGTVKKFVNIGTVCSYPLIAEPPLKEAHLFDGPPEPTNAAYGYAKRILAAQSIAYRQQYGFPAIYLILANLYGPGDRYDETKSHVIPALIHRYLAAVKAAKDRVTIWGSGMAAREFLYVQDAAEAILMATELYDDSNPINIGSGEMITISNLAYKIAEIVDFSGDTMFDTTKPEGQRYRQLDLNNCRFKLGFFAKKTLNEGLKETVKWFKNS